MKFTSNIHDTKIIKPWNVDKNRFATPNEIAKKAIIESIETSYYEVDNNEEMTDKDKQEVKHQITKHLESLIKRFNIPRIVTTNYISS